VLHFFSEGGQDDAPRQIDVWHAVALAPQVTAQDVTKKQRGKGDARLRKREEIDDGRVISDIEQALGGSLWRKQRCGAAQVRVRCIAGVAALEYRIASANGAKVVAAEVTCGGELGGDVVTAQDVTD
jgi:hypothetical protein